MGAVTACSFVWIFAIPFIFVGFICLLMIFFGVFALREVDK
jgi:hypothetical protein